ncbi:MAG: zf-HC2 domain-containing protein [Polyangiales bacterium]
MTCDAVELDLTGFHFATLDPEARRAVEGHLVACPRCVAAYLAVKRAVESEAEAPPPSPASRARLREAVAAAVRPRAVKAAWSWWERPLAATLAAASVALALGAMHAVATSPGAAPHGLRDAAPPR